MIMRRRRVRQNQSGQAIIEYLLILIVVIALVLGLAYQFNSAFRVYVTNYFGNYIACLLETGELPSLGANGAGGRCGAEFGRSFNLADGRPLVGTGGGGGGGGGGGTAGPGDRAGGGGGRGSSSSSGSGGGGGGSPADGGAGSGGPQTAASYFNRRGRPPRTAVGNASGSEEKSYTGNTEAGKGRGRRVGEVNRDTGRVTRSTLDRRFISTDELEQRSNEKQTTTKAGETGSTGGLRPKRLSYEAKRSVAAANDVEVEEFGFGKMLRILMIVLIIIALVLLIGGQLLQISKSWEK
jgi:hypothetical protein